MDKIIHHSITLERTSQEVFELFTVNEHLKKWLTNAAYVEPKVGGKYELYWDPTDKENESTIGCKILALVPFKLLCFEWKGPSQFKHFMNTVRPLTHVAVFFSPSSKGTEVHLIHSGWGDTKEWEEARLWFEKAWVKAFSKLQNLAKPISLTENL